MPVAAVAAVRKAAADPADAAVMALPGSGSRVRRALSVRAATAAREARLVQSWLAQGLAGAEGTSAEAVAEAVLTTSSTAAETRAAVAAADPHTRSRVQGT
jgi:hypothetical protein